MEPAFPYSINDREEVTGEKHMNTRKHFSRLGWAYVAFGTVSLVAQIIMLVIAALLGYGDLNINLLTLISEIGMYGCGFPVFYLMIRTIPAWKKPESEGLSFGSLLRLLIVCFGLMYIGSLIGKFTNTMLEMVMGESVADPVTEWLTDLNPWLLFACIVVVAPVMEELMFRKLLIDRIVPYGQKAAILVSGISFGLFHGNFQQFFYACGLGIVFAYIYSSTGRIYYTIIFHMVINFVCGMAPVLLVRAGDMQVSGAELGNVLFGIFIIASMLGAVVIWCFNWSKLSFFSRWEPVEGSLAKVILLSPGVLVFIVGCIVTFAQN